MISMKMSASWEAEKSSSCSIRRLCHILIGQIILDRPIDLGENTSNGVYVALRMRGNTRRILRSPEISLIVPKPLPSLTTSTNSNARGAGGYILIDLNCTIQYSHVLKMDSNILQILLQKRKKYKNTTVNLGYKTLAYCNINLSQVLQRRVEHRFLNMYPDPKCIGPVVARVEVHCLSTLPWEREPTNCGNKGEVESDGCLDDGCLLPADVFSDDADEDSDSEEEVDLEDVDTSRCGRVGGASSTTVPDANRGGQKKVQKSKSVGQIKQKVISLLKRLKLADPNEIDTGTTLHLWEEIDKIEAESDVDEDSDVDTGGTAESGSLPSVPRPSIQPFFGHTGSSEETLSLDAGARLLRRLQKEALLAPDPVPPRLSPPPQPPTTATATAAAPSGTLNETSNTTTEMELRRQAASTASNTSGARGCVKFPSRFGPIKTRRTVPAARRRQITSTPPIVSATTTTVASSSQEPTFINGHYENVGRSSIRNSALMNCSAMNDIESIDCERTEDDSSGSLAQAGISNLPASLADVQFVVSNLEPGGKTAAAALNQAGCTKLARVSSFQEVRQILSGLVSWAQMHHVEGGGREIRFCVVGGDALLNAVLRAFVEVAGARSEAVAAAFRFFLVPVSGLVPIPPSRQQQQQNSTSRHRRSISSTLPPLSPSSDLVRPPYPGSPSISREPTSTPMPPPLSNLIAQRLCSIDPLYARLFGRLATGEGVGGADTTAVTPPQLRGRRSSAEGSCAEGEFVRRVIAYLSTAECLLPLPIGECLVAGVRNNLPLLSGGSRAGGGLNSTTASFSPPALNPPLPMGTTSLDCGSSLEEEAGKQTLVPFLLCIRLGNEAILRSCLGEASQSLGSEPIPMHSLDATTGGGGGDHHPPGAPHLTSRSPASTSGSASSPSSLVPSLISGSNKQTYELQLEYWALNVSGSGSVTVGVGGNAGGSTALVHSTSLDDRGSVGSGGGGCGNMDGRSLARPVTFKAICRTMVVGLINTPLCVPTPLPQKPSTLLNLAMITREKKPKIMRIGKKTSKEVTFKPELTEGITRLICTCKGVVSHASVSAEPTEAGLGLAPAGRCADIASPSPFTAAQPQPSHHIYADSTTPEIATSHHHSGSFSTRDDFACGLGVSTQSGSSSGDHVFVRISIDGVDWPTSRFFQVAPGWRTHVKVFPLVSMSPLSSSSAFALPLAKVRVGLSGHVPPSRPPPLPTGPVAAPALTQPPTIAHS